VPRVGNVEPLCPSKTVAESRHRRVLDIVGGRKVVRYITRSRLYRSSSTLSLLFTLAMGDGGGRMGLVSVKP
jgi:hypothetical protein